jgi:hypothetical protein
LFLGLNFLIFENYLAAQSSDLYMICSLIYLWLFRNKIIELPIFKKIITIILISVMGFYIKSPFILISYSIFIGLEMSKILKIKKSLYNLKDILITFLAIIISFFITHFVFSRLGEHSGYPRDININFINTTLDFCVSFMGSLISLFSLDKLYDLITRSSIHESRLPFSLSLFFILTGFSILFFFVKIHFYNRSSKYYWEVLFTIMLIGLTTFILRITESGIDYNSRIYFFSAILIARFVFDYIFSKTKSFAIRRIFFFASFVPFIALLYGKANTINDGYCATKSGFLYSNYQNDCSVLTKIQEQVNSNSYDLLLLPYYGFSLDIEGIKTSTYHEPWDFLPNYFSSKVFKAKNMNILLLSFKHKSKITIGFFEKDFFYFNSYELIDSTNNFNIYNIKLNNE